MANLVIGGNTYQGISYVKFNNTGGTQTTFVERTNTQGGLIPTALFISAIAGNSGITAAIGDAVIEKTSLLTVQANLIFEGA